MEKYWIWFFLIAIAIFDIYHIYYGFETRSIPNFFDHSGANEKFKVGESPVMFWCSMVFHMAGILFVTYIAIISWRNKIAT